MALKIFLTGGDAGGWALDDDLAQVRTAVKSGCKDVVFTDRPEEAEIIHSVWPLTLQQLGFAKLRDKKVITHLPTDPSGLIENPYFPFYCEVTSLWIAQSRSAFYKLPRLGISNVDHVPYAIDSRIFNRNVEFSAELTDLRTTLARVASGRVIIGSFQRDSEGGDLTSPKLLKGPDILLELAEALQRHGVPIHFLLAGPRRHWLRSQLTQRKIPYTYFGEMFAGDDYDQNIVARHLLAQLYRLIDVYIVSSRSEGGPRAILEASACETPLLSTPVGIAPDLLDASSLFSSVSEGVERFMALGFDKLRGVNLRDSAAKKHSGENLSEFISTAALEPIKQRSMLVAKHHTPEACAPLWNKIYEQIVDVSTTILPGDAGVPAIKTEKSKAGASLDQELEINLVEKIKKSAIRGLNQLGLKSTVARLLRPILSPRPKIHVSMIYKFHKPPYGGGNQFFRALQSALLERGVRVSENRYHSDVDVYLLNSNWFPVERFRDYADRRGLAVVHRIDGPTAVVRGDGNRQPDDECFALNAAFATRTVMQSLWSYETTLRSGYQPKNPCVIPNAVDPSIFFPNNHAHDGNGAKLKLIASSWSDNPRKGGAVLRWMDSHLDWSKYEMTFVGRVQEKFENITSVPAVDSKKLASLLRAHDVYFTASESDPCSNALIEGLSCGLPAIYRNDGGHPELVSWGGVGFSKETEIPKLLEELCANLESYRNLVSPPSINEIAGRYIKVLELAIGDTVKFSG